MQKTGKASCIQGWKRNGNLKAVFRVSPLLKARAKAQSAMEYLMTYGWAILIISIVLAALFQLGVFNPMAYAPKAQPGACQVFRPDGPGTTSFINLEGVCNGELPQYVAQFNGQNSYIVINFPYVACGATAGSTSGCSCTGCYDTDYSLPVGSYIPQLNETFVEWFYPFKLNGSMQVIMGNGCDRIFWLNPSNNELWFNTWSETDFAGSKIIPNKWYQLVYVLSAKNGFYAYLNGQLYATSNTVTNCGFTGCSGFNWAWQYYIGSGFNCRGSPYGNYFDGYIANVQLYDSALSSNGIKSLYQEGIGGAPIRLQNLVGWWPLNGNANDYSGNGHNGVATGVTFTGSWYSGYTPP